MTMRQLRDTRRLKALLKAGKSIRLQDRANVVGRIVPPGQAVPRALPDFEARHRKLFGEHVFHADNFLQDRHGRY